MFWRLALAAFSIAACLFAQENPVTTFRTESNLVSLNVSAFDQEGRIVSRVHGQISEEELKERLEWLLGDRTRPKPPALVRYQ